MNPENIMVSKKHQTQWSHIVGFHWYEMSRRGKFIETERWLVAARSWGKGGMGNDGLVYRISWGNDHVPELDTGDSCTIVCIYYKPMHYIQERTVWYIN